MGLRYENLDEATRRFMIEEINADIDADRIYVSNYLNPEGCESWPRLLMDAARQGTDQSLALAIRSGHYLKRKHQRRNPRGGFISADVPVNAHETLGEGEFNRFYIRGLCLRAIEQGAGELEVYRAKNVREPRPESQRKIGQRVNAAVVLDDLRRTTGVEPALGLPPGPNSGLTLRLTH